MTTHRRQRADSAPSPQPPEGLHTSESRVPIHHFFLQLLHLLHLAGHLGVGVGAMKVGRVVAAGRLRLKGGLQLELLQQVPVDAGEPTLLLHHVGAALGVAEAARGPLAQEAPDELGTGPGHALGELHGALEDVLVGLQVVLGVERRHANAKLVAQHTQRPVVHRPVVAVVADELRRQVVRRAAQGEGLGAGRQDLRQAEVHDLDVAVGVQHQVLRLDVSVRDAVRVHVRQRQQHAGHVEAGGGLLEVSALAQVREQLSTLQQLQHEEDAAGGGEGAVQADDEGVPAHLQDDLLVVDALLQPVLHDGLLALGLESKRLLRGLATANAHHAEGAVAQQAQHVELLQAADEFVPFFVTSLDDTFLAAFHRGGQLLHLGLLRVVLLQRAQGAHQSVEVLARHAEAHRGPSRHAGRSALVAGHQSALAKDGARLQRGDQLTENAVAALIGILRLAPGRDVDVHAAGLDEVAEVAFGALAEDDVAVRKVLSLQRGRQSRQLILGQQVTQGGGVLDTHGTQQAHELLEPGLALRSENALVVPAVQRPDGDVPHSLYSGRSWRVVEQRQLSEGVALHQRLRQLPQSVVLRLAAHGCDICADVHAARPLLYDVKLVARRVSNLDDHVSCTILLLLEGSDQTRQLLGVHRAEEDVVLACLLQQAPRGLRLRFVALRCRGENLGEPHAAIEHAFVARLRLVSASQAVQWQGVAHDTRILVRLQNSLSSISRRLQRSRPIFGAARLSCRVTPMPKLLPREPCGSGSATYPSGGEGSDEAPALPTSGWTCCH
eukprot:scaffold3100_cov248-Pinguiococcus_pyrenoidosus.AAC.3